MCEQKDSQWKLVRTLIGVTGGALIGLRPVVTFVKTLVSTGNGDTIVIGQEPTEMLSDVLPLKG